MNIPGCVVVSHSDPRQELEVDFALFSLHCRSDEGDVYSYEVFDDAGALIGTIFVLDAGDQPNVSVDSSDLSIDSVSWDDFDPDAFSEYSDTYYDAFLD